MSLKDKIAVVTGGSRALGLGLVEALVAQGAQVTVVARGAEALAAVHDRVGVATIAADVTDEAAARDIIAEIRPDIVALNAGAEPRMGRLDQLSWEDFTLPWETDVKAGLYWPQAARRVDRLAGVEALRPELHRYCARLMGSVIDGEDIVQDTFMRVLTALPTLDGAAPLRPWLFRIAHNRALDVLRGGAIRMTEPIDAADGLANPESPDAEAMLMRREAVATAVSRFVELPVVQRGVVVLKDVLDHSPSEIATPLGLTVDAVKGHLARGRARLRVINARAAPTAEARSPSAAPMSACSSANTPRKNR